MRQEPGILFVTWSLHKADWINKVILEALFVGEIPLGEEPSAPLDDKPTSPVIYLKIFKGLRISLTLNANKRLGFRI
jgi:hypothetical protein